jgi:cytosine deaminase
MRVKHMDSFLVAAIDEAKAGLAEGGIPIGSVLVYKDKIIGRGHNRRIQKESTVLHAEIGAIENCGRKYIPVFKESRLYTTLSPCSMCTGAILLYKIPHVIIGENRNFQGEEELLKARGVKVDVINDIECLDLMKDFIMNNPELWNEDIGEK